MDKNKKRTKKLISKSKCKKAQDGFEFGKMTGRNAAQTVASQSNPSSALFTRTGRKNFNKMEDNLGTQGALEASGMDTFQAQNIARKKEYGI